MDSNPAKWEIDPHTRAKHQILERYLGGWFPKMASWNNRLVFLDGFAGRGVYEDGSEGSPVIALRRLVEHRHAPNMTACKFQFYFIEKNSQNAESLVKTIKDFEETSEAPVPSNVDAVVVNDTFENVAREITDALTARGTRLAPTFAFIDPFGYTGLSITTIADLLRDSKSEVFINFMVGHVQRFVERDGQESAIQSLFGLTPEEVMAGHDGTRGAARIRHLRDVYMNQLRLVANFTYVHSFEMRNQSGNVTYYLIHGTRHLEGVKTMKEAMWKLDPGGGQVFADRLAGQTVLFTPDPDVEPLKRALHLQFAGQSDVFAEDLEKFVLLETPYREVHMTKALRELERQRIISVIRRGRSGYKRDGYTRISFV
ncbi:three-Cys-motif partner protein TcmP [Cnuibacter physcomitrellae]|uniref:three-Cys-motif partner protein TcmP n=1 Tax=Cnuibacter physcomitrellae TaxID=1619308 RepID=UPI002175880B|nr:three-Cys-motif partner protein TcmP [Cnuibacter physcomitrellae]MCS5498374.1 three-Cys-motif partner protein TcmP [Cnuibacter physcomitrellae]